MIVYWVVEFRREGAGMMFVDGGNGVELRENGIVGTRGRTREIVSIL